MYKSATKVHSVFSKRPNRQISYPYRVFQPKREPTSSKGPNVITNQSWRVEYHKLSRKLLLSDAYYLHIHLQRKWITRFCKLSQNEVKRVAVVTTVGSTRMFSGKSNEKENKEKKKNISLGLCQNKDGKETGCNMWKSSKNSSAEVSESCRKEIVHNRTVEVDNATQQHEHLNKIHSDAEKKRKEPTKLAVNKFRKKQLEKEGVLVETSSTRKVEDFDRLQLLKGKLIRKLGKKWLSYENISDTFDNFPYYISKNTKSLLLECIAARLKKHDFPTYGESLPSTSHLILLQGQPGTETYQEVLVRAIARHTQASLLVVDTDTLSAKGFKDDVHITESSTEEHKIRKSSMEEHKNDDEKGSVNEILCAEKKLNNEAMGLASLDRVTQVFGGPVKIIDLKNSRGKFGIPWKVLRFPIKKEGKKGSLKFVEVGNHNWADELKNLVVTSREGELKKLGKQGEELKIFWHDLIVGDHVRYKGLKAPKARARAKVTIGQEGFVSSISDSLPWKVCVKFQGKQGPSDADEVFCDAAELEKVESSLGASDEAWLARFPELPIEALCKMVLYRGPVIVHFPDIQRWFSSAPPSKVRELLFKKVKDLLNTVSGPVVFVATSITEDSKSTRSNSAHSGQSAHSGLSLDLGSILNSIMDDAEKIRAALDTDEIDPTLKIFKNVIQVFPPEERDLLRVWQKQLEEDKKNTKKLKNYVLLEEILEQNSMCCAELADISTFDLELTPESAADVVGWARNMIFHSNQIQTSGGKLLLQKLCLEKALLRFRALKVTAEDKFSHLKELAENEYEVSLLSSVVLAHDIGVKFQEIGALENIKNTLQELIVLPLQRPELFRKGNLRKPCKGVLLFGPPGTGKTLVAKAVATEAGANFINVSASSITSKFYGDDERLVRALFALAKKLSPVVIFIDEVDSLLGARDSSSEHEAMRKLKTEFMASWDGLQSKENEQILVFATTNRPFDLDDAVIRRLPRRLLVDLPNTENRVSILRLILANEDLDSTFCFNALASQTKGYSGSDLKNLCMAAAYIPIREFLEAEQQVKGSSKAPTILRPLCLNDFLQAKNKIGPSLAYDSASMIQLRQWNEQYGEGGSRWHKTFGFSH